MLFQPIIVKGFCFHFYGVVIICRNPSLGLTTKVKACKGAGQEGSPGLTSRALGTIGMCEGTRHYAHWEPFRGI
jgi:hypothetical protein